jgi:hypothetical protein
MRPVIDAMRPGVRAEQITTVEIADASLGRTLHSPNCVSLSPLAPRISSVSAKHGSQPWPRAGTGDQPEKSRSPAFVQRVARESSGILADRE